MSLLCAIDQVQRGLKRGDQRQKDSALIDSTSICKYIRFAFYPHRSHRPATIL